MESSTSWGPRSDECTLRQRVRPAWRCARVDGHQSRDSQLGVASPQRQIPDRTGRDLQPVHLRTDRLLQPLLQDAAASDSERDRCQCYPVVTPRVQADAPPDQGGKTLVRPVAPNEPRTLCLLAVMPWQRPNVGSRVDREVQAQLWERPKVKFLRATP